MHVDLDFRTLLRIKVMHVRQKTYQKFWRDMFRTYEDRKHILA